MDSVEVTNDSPPAEELKEVPIHTTEETDTTSTAALPQEMSAAEEPVKTSMDILTDEPTTTSNTSVTTVKINLPVKSEKELLEETPFEVPLNSIARITSDESSEESKQQSKDRKIIVQSKPIPPSLRGHSPFVEPTAASNKTEPTSTSEPGITSTQKPVEKESHEVFRESKVDNLPEKSENKPAAAVHFPPLSVYNVNNGDPDESSARVVQTEAPQSAEVTTAPEHKESSEPKFFTRVVAEEVVTSTLRPVTTAKPNTDNDFFVVTENPSAGSGTTSTVQPPTAPPQPLEKSEAPQTDQAVVSPDQEMADEAAPEAPERPNRGRLLIRPQHHSFYPYFLNRVLG